METEVEEDSRSTAADTQCPYLEVLASHLKGVGIYTSRGAPEWLKEWRNEHMLWLFQRAIVTLTEHTRNSEDHALLAEEQELLLEAQYSLYKGFYRMPPKSTDDRRLLSKRLGIPHVECELAKSPQRRHRLATWIVEHFAPLEPIGIRLLDAYESFRPAR